MFGKASDSFGRPFGHLWRLQETPKRLPRRPKKASWRAFGRPRSTQGGPRAVQEPARGPQDAPKSAPRASKSAPRASRRPPTGAQDHPRRTKRAPKASKMDPKSQNNRFQNASRFQVCFHKHICCFSKKERRSNKYASLENIEFYCLFSWFLICIRICMSLRQRIIAVLFFINFGTQNGPKNRPILSAQKMSKERPRATKERPRAILKATDLPRIH